MHVPQKRTDIDAGSGGFEPIIQVGSVVVSFKDFGRSGPRDFILIISLIVSPAKNILKSITKRLFNSITMGRYERNIYLYYER